MDRFEAARRLGLADADVLGVETTGDGTKVTTRDGGDRLITEDAVLALIDHPATAQLRRHEATEQTDEAEPADEQTDGPGKTPGEDGEVPDGTADAVLTWVGEDSERAQRALDAETGRDHPRSTLVDKLRKLAG